MARCKGNLCCFYFAIDFRASLLILFRSTARRAKNSPQDCFLNARSNPLPDKKLRTATDVTVLNWRAARDSNP